MSEQSSEPVVLGCPFCGGAPRGTRVLRDGYETCPGDPDAWAYTMVCTSCAAEGGWAKTHAGAVRHWNLRVPVQDSAARKLLERWADWDQDCLCVHQGESLGVLTQRFLANEVDDG